MSSINVGFYPKDGKSARTGYVLAYRGAMGMQVLLGSDGEPETYSKTETHAANYGKRNDAHKAYQAMTSTAWSRL